MSLYRSKFTIEKVDKNFDHVSRIYGSGRESILELDVHNMFFKFFENEDPTGKTIDLHMEINGVNVDDYDYSMHGTIYEITSEFVLVSFGGLLMKLEAGDVKKHFHKVMLNKNVYCLINT